MNPSIPIKFNFPLWIPPISEKSRKEYLGLKLDKPYWIFVYKFPDGSGFFQTIHGLN